MLEIGAPGPDNRPRMTRGKSAWTPVWRDRYRALEDQAAARGFSVEVVRKLPVPYARYGVVDLGHRVVYLSAWMTPRRALSTLAHELGHIDVDEDIDIPVTRGGWCKPGPGRPVRHVIADMMVDEVRAWDAAYHIASQAGVPTDGWDAHRAAALLGYARRAVHQTRRPPGGATPPPPWYSDFNNRGEHRMSPVRFIDDAAPTAPNPLPPKHRPSDPGTCSPAYAAAVESYLSADPDELDVRDFLARGKIPPGRGGKIVAAHRAVERHMGVGLTDGQLAGYANLYADLDAEGRVRTSMFMMSYAELPGGSKFLDKIQELHALTVDNLLEAFGTTRGRVNENKNPVIPKFMGDK